MKLAHNFGYHWIAYEWWNFRLSCQRCNRPENDGGGELRGKANEFPIRDEALRCKSPTDLLVQEVPRLLDPCLPEDCDLLAHGLDGEVKPAAPDHTWDHERAHKTINLLGFNEWNLPEERRSQWQTVSVLITHFSDPPPQDVIEVVSSYLSPDREYSRFFRSVIGTHRDKAWIESLL